MEQLIKAKLKYLRLTPRKVRFLVDLLRGLPVSEAEAQLMLSSRRAKVALLKLLRSAIANAKHNAKLDTNKLYVKEIKVDQGPKFKHWTPRARGSASPIEKKTSHITLILGFSEKLKPKFNIQPKPKKEKTSPKKSEKEEVPKAKAVKTVESKPKEPGFFRKIFRRKSV